MSRYDVDSAQVAQASAAAGTSVAAIRTEVAALLRHLADLQAGWHGTAATAFGGLLADWSLTQQRVEGDLVDGAAGPGVGRAGDERAKRLSHGRGL